MYYFIIMKDIFLIFSKPVEYRYLVCLCVYKKISMARIKSVTFHNECMIKFKMQSHT